MGFLPSQGENDHNIPLIPSSQPPNVSPYKKTFPKRMKLKYYWGIVGGMGHPYNYYPLLINIGHDLK